MDYIHISSYFHQVSIFWWALLATALHLPPQVFGDTELTFGTYTITSSECQSAKELLAVDYAESAGKPDLSNLTLDYITEEETTVYNLTDLSQILSAQWFNSTNGLVVYFHGYTDNPTKESYGNISQAFYARGNFNIVALDASPYISSVYLTATALVSDIGEAFGTALVNLTDAGLKPSSIYLIGHSLGSHIASFTAKTLYNLTGSKVGRITGLDPAGPCYTYLDPSLRLNKDDAEFVDVVHTNAGVFGLDAVCGHKDYYPNGGTHQPGCDIYESCSHGRAWLYFAESVLNTTGFPAVSCDGWTTFQNGACVNNTISYMGYASEPGITGQYYLQTAAVTPYALGTDGI